MPGLITRGHKAVLNDRRTANKKIDNNGGIKE